MEILRRFLPEITGNTFLFGPRGTGKTMWLRRMFPHAVYVDLLDAPTLRRYAARPERLVVDGVVCEPCEAFLMRLRPGSPLLPVRRL